MYAITDVDMWEWDAFLVIEGDDKRYWFSFNGHKTNYPTLKDAIDFFELDEWKASKDALCSLQRIRLYPYNEQ